MAAPHREWCLSVFQSAAALVSLLEVGSIFCPLNVYFWLICCVSFSFLVSHHPTLPPVSACFLWSSWCRNVVVTALRHQVTVLQCRGAVGDFINRVLTSNQGLQPTYLNPASLHSLYRITSFSKCVASYFFMQNTVYVHSMSRQDINTEQRKVT